MLRRGLALAFGILLVAVVPEVVAAPRFTGEDLGIERKRAYDVGVADYDLDGALDIYSTNHMFRDSLLRGDGDGNFEDVYQSAGFAPNPSIAGIESLTRSPEIDDPGVYLWVQARSRRPHIRIATRKLGRVPGVVDETVSGRIVVTFPGVKIRRQNVAEIEVERKGPRRTVISFELGPSARVVLRPNHIDLPFEVHFDAPLPLENAFLGPRRTPAADRNVTIALGDRHGVAWADLNRDGLNDAVISSGGLAGNSRLVRRRVQDELLLGSAGGLVAATAGSGLHKGSCRGREAQVIDFDGDRRLDVFIGCRRGRPRLFRGRGDGTFREVRRGLRRLGGGGAANRWVDLDNDGRLELVQVGKFFVRTWSLNRRGRARQRQLLRTRNDDYNVESIAPGDFDGDGDLDLFVAAPSANLMLVNRGAGRLVARDPRRYGLPPRHGVAASWVDYDNDGRLDLYVSPDGLLRNIGRGFRAIGALRTPGTPRFARATWFDADRDGRLELVRLTQRGRGLFPQIRLFSDRRPSDNRWLQVDLVGDSGGALALGARVSLRAGGRTQTRWVGQSDGSRFGQGHYRLYFGLGRARQARRLRVWWPDGKVSHLGSVAANRRLAVRR